MGDFPMQEEWFGHMDPINLAIKALKDAREVMRWTGLAKGTSADLAIKLCSYAEQRLRDELGGNFNNMFQYNSDGVGEEH